VRRIVSFLLSALLLMGLGLSVSAAGFTNLDRKGTLTLVMEWDSKPLNSGSLTLYRVGDIVCQSGDDYFTTVPELKDSNISLKKLDDTRLPQKLAELAVQEELEPVKAPIQQGEAVFDGLQTGLYVVMQTKADACDGFEPIAPFLISLPQWNGNQYLYERKAQPKVELEIIPEESEEPTEPTEPESTEPKPTKPSGSTLPQTGQLNWPVPVMAVSGLILLLCGILLCAGKKVDGEE